LKGNNAIWDTSRDSGRHLDWLSKAVRAVPYDAKFTGTAAHGKGGVLFSTDVEPDKSIDEFFDLSTAGMKIFQKNFLENSPARDDK